MGERAKTVWTANYKKALSMPTHIALIATSRSIPTWFESTGREFRRSIELAPSAELLHQSRLNKHFDWKDAYRRELSLKNLARIYGELPDECAMLCYESSWHQCHRKLLFEALHAIFGCAGGEWSSDGSTRVCEQLSFL